jgi:hypothetical protein
VPELTSAEVLDCHGHVTHSLTLLPDGTVEVLIRSSGVRALVDATSGRVLTPGITLPDDLVHAAGALRPR